MRILNFVKWGLALPVVYVALMGFGILILLGVGAAYAAGKAYRAWQRRRACRELLVALQTAADRRAEELARKRTGVIQRGPWKDPRDRQRSFNEHLRDQARGRYH
jgi:hypothetical protein